VGASLIWRAARLRRIPKTREARLEAEDLESDPGTLPPEDVQALDEDPPAVGRG
jgi:hypothetical protein